MYSAGIDGTCRVWNIKTGAEIYSKKFFDDWVWGVRSIKSKSAFSVDGITFASDEENDLEIEYEGDEYDWPHEEVFSDDGSFVLAEDDQELSDSSYNSSNDQVDEVKYSSNSSWLSSSSPEFIAVSTNSDVYLLDSSDLSVLASIKNLIQSAVPSTTLRSYNVMFFRDLDRLLFIEYIAELSCLILGTQTGFVVLLRLVKEEENVRFRLLVQCSLPFEQPPYFTLMGLFVKPFGDPFVPSQRYFILVLLYFDGSVVSYKISKRLESDELYFVQL